jgi:DNA-binding transcriptional regulator YiaG
LATNVNTALPDAAFPERASADRQSRVPRDLPAKDWIRQVREALKLTQEQLGETIGAEGDRTVAKWEGAVAEPRFVYTRRIAVLAPWPLQLTFLGRSSDSPSMSDPDRTVLPAANEGEKLVVTPEGIMVGKELDEIEDVEIRKRARTAALAAIDAERSKSHPPELDADQKRHRVQRK